MFGFFGHSEVKMKMVEQRRKKIKSQIFSAQQINLFWVTFQKQLVVKCQRGYSLLDDCYRQNVITVV
jgi:hypothetical protein